MKTKQIPSWYVSRLAGDHQGAVADEKTGATIALVYDKANAPLLAAAPRMLAVLKFALENGDEYEAEKRIRALITELEGNQS